MRCTAWPGWRIALLLLAVASGPSAATAQLIPIDSSSTINVVHVAGFPQAVPLSSNPSVTFPSGLLGAPVTDTLTNQPGGVGPIDQSDATISAGRLTDGSTFAKVSFGGNTSPTPGTGVTQFVPSGQPRQAALSQITFSAMWQSQTTPFGGQLSAGYSIPLIMDVAANPSGVGLQVSMTVSVYTDQAMTNLVSRQPLTPLNYSNTTPTGGVPLMLTLSDDENLSFSVPAGDYLVINGMVTFTAQDANGQSDISIPNGQSFDLFTDLGPAPVPEPGSLALLGLVSGAWAARRWQRRKRRLAGLSA